MDVVAWAQFILPEPGTHPQAGIWLVSCDEASGHEGPLIELADHILLTGVVVHHPLAVPLGGCGCHLGVGLEVPVVLVGV